MMKVNGFRRFLQFFIYFNSLFLLALSVWTKKYFGPVTIDQTLSTMSFGVEGLISADSIFIKRFIEWCIVWPLMILLGLIVILRVVSCCHFGKMVVTNSSLTQKKLPIIYQYKFSLSIGLIAILIFAQQYDVPGFLINHCQTDQGYFAKHFIDPNKTVFTLGQPKNLVLIYVESLENTYSNKKIFSHDLLYQLNNLPVKKLQFSNYQQMPGTSWTIAGIIASQCAIPLKQLTIFGNNRFGENVSHMLKNEKCLSDILAEYSYKNIFLSGASLKIGGKGTFLQDHHYNEIYGKQQWLDEGYQESDFYCLGFA